MEFFKAKNARDIMKKNSHVMEFFLQLNFVEKTWRKVATLMDFHG